MAWKRSSVRIRYSPLKISSSIGEIFSFMYFVYVLYSRQLDRYYVGQTDNIEERLQSHLSGISKYTSSAKDWTIVHHESFQTREEAIKRENEIKRKKSRKYIEWLCKSK